MVKKKPKRLYGWENLPVSLRFRPFWGLFNFSRTHIGFKRGSHIAKWSLEHGEQSGQKNISFGQNRLLKKRINNNKKNHKYFCNFSYVSNWRKKVERGLVAKVPTVIFFFLQIWFNFTRYGRFWMLSGTLKVQFWHKKWIFGPFLKSDNKQKSILIIFHIRHLLFSMFFLNVALYTLLARSCTTILTPINVHFF